MASVPMNVLKGMAVLYAARNAGIRLPRTKTATYAPKAQNAHFDKRRQGIARESGDLRFFRKMTIAVMPSPAKHKTGIAIVSIVREIVSSSCLRLQSSGILM